MFPHLRLAMKQRDELLCAWTPCVDAAKVGWYEAFDAGCEGGIGDGEVGREIAEREAHDDGVGVGEEGGECFWREWVGGFEHADGAGCGGRRRGRGVALEDGDGEVLWSGDKGGEDG